MREVVVSVPEGALEDVLDRLLPIVPGGVRERPLGAYNLELRMRGETVPTLAQLRSALGPLPHQIREHEVSDDWRERRLAEYSTDVIGDRIVVRPPWAPVPAPGLIDVCLDAYGWSGPWAERRGFDSLVQMSAGIADAGMSWRRSDHPIPLPVQALDHATGYLTAAAAIRGVERRLATGRGVAARLSLARTAKLLLDLGAGEHERPLTPETPSDVAAEVETTPWGGARRLNPPVSIQHIPMHWSLPACELGSSPAGWSPLP